MSGGICLYVCGVTKRRSGDHAKHRVVEGIASRPNASALSLNDKLVVLFVYTGHVNHEAVIGIETQSCSGVEKSRTPRLVRFQEEINAVRGGI